MAANLTVAANKRVRGEILALLYSVQPVPVEIRTITNSLLESNMVSVPSIAQHIDYLSGKKYIQVIGEEAAEQILHGVVPPSAFVKRRPASIWWRAPLRTRALTSDGRPERAQPHQVPRG